MLEYFKNSTGSWISGNENASDHNTEFLGEGKVKDEISLVNTSSRGEDRG